MYFFTHERTSQGSSQLNEGSSKHLNFQQTVVVLLCNIFPVS